MTVRYNSESVATLWSLPESQYIRLRHADFFLLFKQHFIRDKIIKKDMLHLFHRFKTLYDDSYDS